MASIQKPGKPREGRLQKQLTVGGKWGTDGGPHKAPLPPSRWGPALASPRKGASQDGAELSPACSRHTENICWRETGIFLSESRAGGLHTHRGKAPGPVPWALFPRLLMPHVPPHSPQVCESSCSAPPRVGQLPPHPTPSPCPRPRVCTARYTRWAEPSVGSEGRAPVAPCGPVLGHRFLAARRGPCDPCVMGSEP